MKIVKSLITIVAVAAIAVGATSAFFSSSATITDNTFTAGTLEIRVNGQPSVVGATFSPTVPGEVYNSPEYHVNNYGAPHFMTGSSNLTAKYLTIRKANVTSVPDTDLWEKVMIKVETNRGWPAWQQVYEGKLHDMGTEDLLAPNWSELIPGSSQIVRYQVWLPDTGNQNSTMGDTLQWDFVVEGRTS